MTACESSANDGADRTDLVGEPDLERVEAVVDVLGHLGDPDGDPEAWAGKAFVQSDAPFRRCVDPSRPQRFWVDRENLERSFPRAGTRGSRKPRSRPPHACPTPTPAAGSAGSRRSPAPWCCDRPQRANRPCRPMPHRSRRSTCSRNVGGQTPAGGRRCADADQRDVRAQDGGARIGGDGEVARGNDLGGEVADSFLDDRRPALPQGLHFVRIDVHAERPGVRAMQGRPRRRSRHTRARKH